MSWNHSDRIMGAALALGFGSTALWWVALILMWPEGRLMFDATRFGEYHLEVIVLMPLALFIIASGLYYHWQPRSASKDEASTAHADAGEGQGHSVRTTPAALDPSLTPRRPIFTSFERGRSAASVGTLPKRAPPPSALFLETAQAPRRPSSGRVAGRVAGVRARTGAGAMTERRAHQPLRARSPATPDPSDPARAARLK